MEVKNIPRSLEIINRNTEVCKGLFEEQRIDQMIDLWKKIQGNDWGPSGAFTSVLWSCAPIFGNEFLSELLFQFVF